MARCSIFNSWKDKKDMSLDVIAFFAHPDDETMLAGGTLALLASHGARVHVLIATRGEGGELGEPPLCTREQLGQVRENELRCAAQALGAASLAMMDYIDPTVGPEDALFAFTENVEGLAAQVEEAIHYWKAGALISHGINGEYGHPAHKLVYQAARQAVSSLEQEAPLFYTVQGIFPGHPHPRLANEDTPAHLVIDIAPYLAQKTSAALCHKTQHALFVRRRSEEAGRQLRVEEVVQHLESLYRAWPPVDDSEPVHDALADLLWASGCASQRVTG
jgi:N-acetylglucosamine malate deacetylase 2